MRMLHALALSVVGLPQIAAAATEAPAPTNTVVVQAATPSPSPSPSPAASPSAEDEKLLKEIQAATASPAKSSETGSSSTVTPTKSGSLSISNAFNPAMSVNGLFLGSYSSQEHPVDPAATVTGQRVQEIEVQFVTNVDPYFAANLVLSMDRGQGIGVEEGFLAPTWQPYGIAFRVGQLKVPFGRENYQHTHALPFIDKSLVGTAMFGREGLNEFGVEASWLAPLPWYTLVYCATLNGDNEKLFNGPRGSDQAGFAGIKNTIDVTDDATLELGGSYAAGQNATDHLSQVIGSHAIVKWKPSRHATTRSAIFTIEGLYGNQDKLVPNPIVGGPDLRQTSRLGGFYSFLQWQLAKRWFAAGRFDYLGQPLEAQTGISRRGSAILVFAPTEFSALRAQVSETFPAFGADPFYEGFLQLNFTLGAHPAHAY